MKTSPYCSDRRRRHREGSHSRRHRDHEPAPPSRAASRASSPPIPWGCDYYLQTGRMMDADGVDQLLKFDAIYLGAIGDPRVADHISARELILPLRQRLGQWVNLRPMRLMPGHLVAARRPRRRRHRHDLRARELRGRILRHGRPLHARHAVRAGRADRRLHRHGIERIARYAFRWPNRVRGRCWPAPRSRTRCSTRWCCGTKWSPASRRSSPKVELKKYHVDALCARMVTHPQTLDVIVASNLFGDILTDIGSAISGSLGVAPGGNINPDRTTPSMFEPIHGSAPDIAGKGIANPIAAIWAGAMMGRGAGVGRRPGGEGRGGATAMTAASRQPA